MPKQKIFIFHKIPEIGLKMLEKKFEFSKKLENSDAILCLLTNKIDAEVMDKAGKQLKIISNYAVGYNNIDINAAKKRSIMVTNTPGVLTNTVAEHTVGLICAIAQRIPEADKFTRAGKFKGWQPMLLLGTDLFSKTLGIIGLGRIGQRVAEIAQKGFAMKIIYYDKFRNNKYKFAPIKKILKKADFISLHVPLLPSTKHLVSKKELKLMKKTAYLINTSRGPVIDEKALTEALKNKQIAGAALDVFEQEPKLASGLVKLNNVILTPHIASASIETREKMAVIAAQNIIDALEGKKLENLVNK
ncbi:MAG: D-glycerate dehydrogenase [bacterium]